MENSLIITPEIKTLTDLVMYSKELPTIRVANEKEVNQAIGSLILEVFNFYNEIPNDVQLKLMIPVIKEAAKKLTLPDLLIFKNNCLQSKYDLKFRLTPNVIIEWLKEYQYERMEAFENNNLKVKTKIESEVPSIKTIEMLKELADKIKNKQPIYSTDKPTESDVERQSKRLQEWIKKEFKVEWKRQGCQMLRTESNESMYITYNGSHKVYNGKKILAITYLEIRYQEIIEKTNSNFEQINDIIK